MSVYSLTISNGGSGLTPSSSPMSDRINGGKSLIATGFTMKSLAEPVYLIDKLEQRSRN